MAEHWVFEPAPFDYDHDGEAAFRLEGTLHLRDQGTGEESDLLPGYVWFVGQKKGVVFEFSTPDYCTYVWVQYPHWR